MGEGEIMAFCPNCSSPVSGRFCTNCGFDNTLSTPQPYQYPAPQPFPNKAIVAIVFAIISMIMIIIAGALPWWIMSFDMTTESYGQDDTGEALIEFTLQEGSYNLEATSSGDTQKMEDEVDLIGEEEDVGDVTGFLLLVSIIMLIIVVVLLCVMIGVSRIFSMARYTRMFRNLAILLTLITLLFIIIAPIYYLFAWPNAVEETINKGVGGNPELESIMEAIYDGSFSGSNSFSETIEYSYYNEIDVTGESNWGPGIGWILMFICIVFILITLILIKVGGDQAQRMAVMTPVAAQYGYGVQQPQVYQPPPPYLQPQPYPQPTPQPYPQPLPLPQRPSTLPTKVTCPTCKNIIPIQPKSLPAQITCPQCGTRGFVE
jgi:hypothetical protein